MNSLPEWTDLRFFLELARAGTLSGASRRLEVEHTTVARRIDRLEHQLGNTLFDRSREGYELTEMGRALLPHAALLRAALPPCAAAARCCLRAAPLKMATGRKNPQIRGHRTRWTRIRVWVHTRGRGRGYEFKPNGYLLTGFKI